MKTAESSLLLGFENPDSEKPIYKKKKEKKGGNVYSSLFDDGIVSILHRGEERRGERGRH